jgi:hypothetical protein
VDVRRTEIRIVHSADPDKSDGGTGLRVVAPNGDPTGRAAGDLLALAARRGRHDDFGLKPGSRAPRNTHGARLPQGAGRRFPIAREAGKCRADLISDGPEVANGLIVQRSSFLLSSGYSISSSAATRASAERSTRALPMVERYDSAGMTSIRCVVQQALPLVSSM